MHKNRRPLFNYTLRFVVIAAMTFNCGLVYSTGSIFMEDIIPFTVNQPIFPERNFNVIDFGAVGNGKTLETEAIQKAIDSCAAAHGGIVYFPPGVYLSGTIYLSSFVNLHLAKGAILRGSTNLDDFPITIPELRSHTDNYTVRSLIYAEKKENIAITGDGIIDGQGAEYLWPFNKELFKKRPYIIRIIECKNILIKGITLLNSPMWNEHYLACDHLTIQNITVVSRRTNYNTDGIDIEGCHNVRITGCNIKTQDDAMVFKSTTDRSCENIFLDNCKLSSLGNALKCGTESNGGFKNFIIKDVYIYDTGLSGIALEVVDGGSLENIRISDITMENVNNPVFIRLGNRARPYTEGVTVSSVGSVRNITIRNLQAANTGYFSEKHPFQKYNRNPLHIPSSISGLPGHPVKNVRLENIYIQYAEGAEKPYDPAGDIPESETSYPEYSMFGQLPASGFYLRYARNIQFNNIDIEFTVPDSRPLFYLDKNTANISRDGEFLK